MHSDERDALRDDLGDQARQEPAQEARGARALLDGWRDSGADRADPVRFRFIDALARRASGYDGQARQLLEQRLAGLIADFGDGLARTPGGNPSSDGPADTLQPQPGMRSDLASLTERLVRSTQPAAAATPQAPQAPDAPNAPHAPHAAHALAANEQRARHAEPALADYFRETWARVSVDRQLRASQAGVPENAGPLNTNHLVHRSLSLMREVSPGYLEQFLSYVDALSWLEGMHAISLVPDREAQRTPAPRKARARSGKPGSSAT
ncbi:DUF2894 domain-containing protein [Cupriavidus sp. D384]|uniref:DUF2894 domain-containing protein n=1 Tax=Cupriavidus sp. D384 TaxID=1538095 RepID=UPI0009EDE741|nr:DUF2894 domain-containing protein [Cupriavidus sp. D384]